MKMLGRWLGTSLACAALAAAAAPWAGGGTAGACGDNPISAPFAAFGDTTPYTLVPEGNFEGGRGWILAGGARIVPGNNPFAAGGRSLLLGPRAAATSRPLCIELGLPSLRFFTRATPGGILKVDVVYQTSSNTRRVTEFARFGAGQSWWPTPPLLFLVNAPLRVGADGSAVVQFRFTALSGAWQIDDVYVDPRKARMPQ